VKDRVVQAAVKHVLEAIFEADFYPVSYGFRPGKSVHGALEHLRMLLRPTDTETEDGRRLPYQWAIEGDIKGCFDNIDHDALIVRLRRRIGDAKVTRLIRAFLAAGVLSEGQFLRSESGVPQGGILSPVLSNIALSAVEERYERHVWPRHAPTRLSDPAAISRRARKARCADRAAGRAVVFPIRYADDFIILVGAPPGPGQDDRAHAVALDEKEALAAFLKERLGLELSETKTLVTPVTQPMRFLGHHVRVRHHPVHGRMVSTSVIPRECSQRFRERIKDLFRSRTASMSLEAQLQRLNPMLRGWAYFYRHAWGAKQVFGSLDNYVWRTIYRWLRKKHHRASGRRLKAQYCLKKTGGLFHEGRTVLFVMAHVTVCQFKLGWLTPPDFAAPSMESPVRNESRTPGSEGGARKPTR
jgi:group II intron reverse transcriptase/maturase